MIRRCLPLLLIVLLTPTAGAQDADGPLLALNTVQQDAVVLYDVASNTYRDLRFGPDRHHVWDFSPDGCRLLLTLDADGRTPRLYSAALDGSDLRPLVRYTDPTTEPETWATWEPDWSSQGDRIAFTMRRGSGDETTHHTAWVNADGGEPQYYSVTGREFSPQWSPDGNWLAYVSYSERVAGADLFSTAVPTPEPPPGQTPSPATTVDEADLWVVSADGLTKYRLTNFRTGSVGMPRWSPDGELVGFVYSPSNANDMIWMIANAEGAFPTQLSYQWALVLDLTWLPDGTRILGAVRDFNELRENRLWQLDLFEGADESATLYAPDLPLRSADFPRFSPDGRYLALRSAYDTVLVDTRADSLRALDDRVMGNTPPVWQPQPCTP